LNRTVILSYVLYSRWLIALLTIAVLGGVAETSLRSGHAQSTERFTVTGSGVQSQFPDGLTFTIEIQSEIRIDDIRVTFEVGGRGTTQYAYLDLDQSNRPLVNGEWFQRTNSNDRYIPPGSMIKYWFEIIDENGDSYFTEPETWRFDDARFEWDEVTVGTVTILYHGPVRTRAERLANAAIESLELMAGVTGADTKTPIVMVLYNNNAEMIEAVVAKSLASSRELITEGQAFDSESVVLVLAGRSDVGTATHEMTHILVARAAGSRGSVPLWLNEGLAEYGNLDQTISYERFLEWAVGTDRLIPLKSLRSFPGDPNLTLVAYGQGRSVVKYMIDEFGPEKMSELLSVLGTGIDIDDALNAVYGFDIHGLENKWRESIGADPYIEPTPGPTPTPSADPTPTYRLLTQPPESREAESASVDTSEVAESAQASDSASELAESMVDDISITPIGMVHRVIAILIIILSPMLFLAHSYAFGRKAVST